MNDNPDDVDAYLAALFLDGDAAIIECRPFNAYGIPRPTFHADRADAARRCHEAADCGGNVFVGVNARIAAGSGKGENVRHARAFVADFDAGHVTATEPAAMVVEVRERIDRAMLPPPPMLVWSGRGVHAYWLLADTLVDLDLWEMVQEALNATLGSDPAIKDRPRIMRVPGTMNRKPGGSMARIVALTDDRYTVDDVACAVWHANAPEPREADPIAVDAAIGGRSERSGIGAGGRVIDTFNAQTSLRDLLTSFGYDVVGTRFRRPGKDDRAWSGILRHDRHGRDVSCHWSTNDPLNDRKFGQGTMAVRDTFDVFCALAHGGNVDAAVKDAARRLGIALPRQQRDGDVLRAIDASDDAGAFDALYFGDDDAPDRERRMIAILARHTTNPKQVGRLLAAARQRKGAACPA